LKAAAGDVSVRQGFIIRLLQIEAEVKEFWHSLETATNTKQK